MASVLRSRSVPSSSFGKRPANSTVPGKLPPKQKQAALCLNWNGGACESYPCAYGRKHGSCSECGERHKARDRPECAAAYNQARARRIADKEQGGAGAPRT
ncbi:hypothetical protein B0H10DRAFT_1956479 [Mycena sp. CBHHK59/15]|nr:hypothetical protein B0H10DRAFT_1956479 [Mycena sp. CBHHK59/15]